MNQPTDTLKLIDIDDLASMLKVSHRTIWRMIADGLVPQPIRVGAKNIRWPLKEILDWIDARCPPQEQEMS